MKKAFIIALLFVGTFLGAQTSGILISGKKFTTEATEKSLTQDCVRIQEVATIEGKPYPIFKTKASKKYPEGRYFVIVERKGGLKRQFLNEI